MVDEWRNGFFVSHQTLHLGILWVQSNDVSFRLEDTNLDS